jgi:hypothetical protein
VINITVTRSGGTIRRRAAHLLTLMVFPATRRSASPLPMTIRRKLRRRSL